jgi:hypothetical protein
MSRFAVLVDLPEEVEEEEEEHQRDDTQQRQHPKTTGVSTPATTSPSSIAPNANRYRRLVASAASTASTSTGVNRRGSGSGGGSGGGSGDGASSYRSNLQFNYNVQTDIVRVKLYRTYIVQVRGDGSILLSTGARYFTWSTMMAMNEVLAQVLSVHLRQGGNHSNPADWRVALMSPGDGSLKFADMMVIRPVLHPLQKKEAIMADRLAASIGRTGGVGVATSPVMQRVLLNLSAASVKLEYNLPHVLPRRSSIFPQASALQLPIPTQLSEAERKHEKKHEHERQHEQQEEQQVLLTNAWREPQTDVQAVKAGEQPQPQPQQQPHIHTEAGAGTLEVTDDEEYECKICLDREVTTVFIPCGHMAVCSACSETVLKTSKQCLICCSNIDMAFEIRV